jgi:Fe-S cluster biogenesis protein NfuA
MEEKIKEVLNKIRPFLQNDGGDIEFVEFKDGIVYVSVLGACVDCVGLDSTIRDGVELILMEEVDGVIGVEVVNPLANQ